MNTKNVIRILLITLMLVSIGLTGCGGSSSKQKDKTNNGVAVEEHVSSEESISTEVEEDEPFDVGEVLGTYIESIDIMGVEYALYDTSLATCRVKAEYAQLQEQIEVDGIKYQVVALEGVDSSLEEFEIPASIKYILREAFKFSDIKNLVVPNTVEYISGYKTFADSEIETISFPEKIKTDKECTMFLKCSNLKNVAIPKGVEIIEDFSEAGFVSVTIPDSVHTIGPDAFYNCSNLEEVVLPNSITTIGYEAFASCTSLKRLNIPNGVVELALDFGKYTAIEELIIPDSVSDYTEDTISYMPNLKVIKFSNSVKRVCDEFDECPNLELIIFPDGIQDADCDIESDEQRHIITIQVEENMIDYFKNRYPECNVIAKE